MICIYALKVPFGSWVVANNSNNRPNAVPSATAAVSPIPNHVVIQTTTCSYLAGSLLLVAPQPEGGGNNNLNQRPINLGVKARKRGVGISVPRITAAARAGAS